MLPHLKNNLLGLDPEKEQLTLNEVTVGVLYEDIKLPIEMCKEKESEDEKGPTEDSEESQENDTNVEENIEMNDASTVCGDDGAPVDDLQQELADPIIKTSDTDKQASMYGNLYIAGRYMKMAVLVMVWIFVMCVFLMDDGIKTTKIMLAPGQKTNIEITNLELPKPTADIWIRITGPFVSDSRVTEDQIEVQVFRVLNVSEYSFDYDYMLMPVTYMFQNQLTLYMDGNDVLSSPVTKTHLFKLPSDIEDEHYSTYYVTLVSKSSQSTILSYSFSDHSLDAATGFTYATLLLIVLFVILVFELLPRAVASVLMASVSVAVLNLCGERLTLLDLSSWLHLETLLLIFSTMLITSVLIYTGTISMRTIFIYQIAKGKPWVLASIIGFLALTYSMMNSTVTIVLLTPLVLSVCEVADVKVQPIMMTLIMCNNIAGVAYKFSSPTNSIISNDKIVNSSNVLNSTFYLELIGGCVFVLTQTVLQLYSFHLDVTKLSQNFKSVRDARHVMLSLRFLTKGSANDNHKETRISRIFETLIRTQLENINKTQDTTKENFKDKLIAARTKNTIVNKANLVKISVVEPIVLFIFMLASINIADRMTVAWTAGLAALLLLIVVDFKAVEPLFKNVHWSSLIFYCGIMVFSQSLCKLGFVNYIWSGLTALLNYSGNPLLLAIILILWMSTFLSALLNNIPVTSAMVGLVTSLHTDPNVRLSLGPLLAALSFGACIGGNATLMASCSNIAGAGLTKNQGHGLKFREFLKIGVPVMLGNLIVASAYLFLCYGIKALYVIHNA